MVSTGKQEGEQGKWWISGFNQLQITFSLILVGFLKKEVLALEELLLPALVWILSLGLCLKHCENIPAPWRDPQGCACSRKPQSRGFQPGAGGGHSQRIWSGPLWSGTSAGTRGFGGLFVLLPTWCPSGALRAGCPRTPGRCPGALPRPRSCPSLTARPPGTAPARTTCMERAPGCARAATGQGWCQPEPCPAREWRSPSGEKPREWSGRRLFPAGLVGLAMARAWIAPGAEQRPWQCPWNHPEHSRRTGLCLPQGSADVRGRSAGPSRVFH